MVLVEVSVGGFVLFIVSVCYFVCTICVCIIANLACMFMSHVQFVMCKYKDVIIIIIIINIIIIIIIIIIQCCDILSCDMCPTVVWLNWNIISWSWFQAPSCFIDNNTVHTDDIRPTDPITCFRASVTVRDWHNQTWLQPDRLQPRLKSTPVSRGPLVNVTSCTQCVTYGGNRSN